MARSRGFHAVTAAAVVLAGGLLWVGARGAGPVPPLGPLLDPARGAWAIARAAERPARSVARIPDLTQPVRVLVDQRDVPHIFAATALDAARALGWLTARDRLFQMELQARAGEGTLTELVGARALPLDRETRALGLDRAIARSWAALADTADERQLLDAFSAGVNAWIDAGSAAELPLEYRLLGVSPRRWHPSHTLAVLARMNYTLSAGAPELDRLAAASLVGTAAAEALFPRHAPLVEPVIPARRAMPAFDLPPLPDPGAPDSAAGALLRTLAAVLPSRARDAEEVSLGSNNWAVAAGRTKAGRALLAGDPHLELSLPSIWYEAHVVVPGDRDAYGVLVPGTPVLAIGFTREVAWSVTNVSGDFTDAYRETVDDARAPTRHRVDGAWRPVETWTTTYRDPRGRIVAVDTLRATFRGPLRLVGDTWLSLRWTALEGGHELRAGDRLARARSIEEALAAQAEWQAPPLNLLLADRSGRIALRVNGRFPVRPGDGRGDVIRDGATSSADWTGDLPPARLPQAIAPEQGFLASANQESVDPRDDDTYLGSTWPSPWRALRINALLRADSAVTPEAMSRWQVDAGNARADLLVPAFLGAVRALGAAAPASARAAATYLARWDRRFGPENRHATLFEQAGRELGDRLWDELWSVEDSGGRTVRRRPRQTPAEMVLLSLLRQPASAWWDDRRTPAVERRDELLAQALGTAWDTLLARHGPAGGDAWRWSERRPAMVPHLLRLRPLGRYDIAAVGGSGTLSPRTPGSAHGASWRMVVELGDTVRAWGIYPGGQRGNPVAHGYADRLPRWARGELDTLPMPRTAAELPAATVRERLTLEALP
ncbi:MAG: penicillin acylase family protein [Gemmatimonadales bacterium]|nr:penicillin acylase family protein [Gemmatimonadales bacterium]